MKSNVRFVAIWAAFVAVVGGGLVLVAPLGIAHWTDAQTAAAVTVNTTGSAFVLALIAHFWPASTEEPAAVQGATSTFVIAIIACGSAFTWWTLEDPTGQLVVAFAIAVLGLVLVIFNRSTAYAPSTVDKLVTEARATAHTPEVVFGAIAPKLLPPGTVVTPTNGANASTAPASPR